ncbi:MAG: antA/AntB antirepressor family protein [Sarcina sp.]
MKTFQRTISGQTYKGEVFERLDIINKFNRSEKDWILIDQYQKTFPQLLLNDVEGFVIDARILWRELGEPQGKFADWSRRKIKEIYSKASDYEVLRKLEKNSKGGRPEENYMLTLETAKAVALGAGTTKNSGKEVREKGQLVRKYFITMEKILKEYELWLNTRHPEREGYKKMKYTICEWCKRRDYDYLEDIFYTREANMLNLALTGMKAMDIRVTKHVLDKQTRDNLSLEVNQALATLQEINIALLQSDMDFDIREQIIKNNCEITYKHIKENFV